MLASSITTNRKSPFAWRKTLRTQRSVCLRALKTGTTTSTPAPLVRARTRSRPRSARRGFQGLDADRGNRRAASASTRLSHAGSCAEVTLMRSPSRKLPNAPTQHEQRLFALFRQHHLD